MIYLKLNAGNDKNGNPRRLNVVMSPFGIAKVYDEGCTGDSPVTKDYPGIELAETISILPSEYRRLKARYKAQES